MPPTPMICFPTGGGSTDPDFGIPDVGSGRPDNSLPTLPGYPANGLPGGGVIDSPGRPVQLPAAPPVFPNNDLPDTVFPGFPAHPLPGPPGGPSTLPLPPGMVWPPLPPILGSQKYMVIVLIPGIGARWAIIDPALRPGTLPGATPSPKG